MTLLASACTFFSVVCLSVGIVGIVEMVRSGTAAVAKRKNHCPHCGAPVDARGRHGTSIPKPRRRFLKRAAGLQTVLASSAILGFMAVYFANGYISDIEREAFKDLEKIEVVALRYDVSVNMPIEITMLKRKKMPRKYVREDVCSRNTSKGSLGKRSRTIVQRMTSSYGSTSA